VPEWGRQQTNRAVPSGQETNTYLCAVGNPVSNSDRSAHEAEDIMKNKTRVILLLVGTVLWIALMVTAGYILYIPVVGFVLAPVGPAIWWPLYAKNRRLH